MPRQIPTALALFFVVAFGSSLDVAAIQQDSPEPLDYNAELVTLGKSPQGPADIASLIFYLSGNKHASTIQVYGGPWGVP